MYAHLAIPALFNFSDDDLIPASELNPGVYDQLVTEDDEQRDSDYGEAAAIRVLYQLADVKHS
jgi:hypothetical protein